MTSYPNFAGKHAEEALVTPGAFLAYQRRLGRLDGYEPPDGVVLCYQRSLYEHVLREAGVSRPPRRHSLLGLVRLPGSRAGIGVLGQFGIGAPAAAAAVEELAAAGTSRFVSIGTAGSLQPDLHVGDLVVATAAIRDEGVSHHYLPGDKYAEPSGALTASLLEALRARGVRGGASWTIDTPYRETVAEARHYQGEGVCCVEMEAAALFAVAEVRALEVAAAFTISDSLAELVWDPQFHGTAVEESLVALFDASVTVLRAAVTGSH